jgi:hypothetical protein
MVNTMTPRKLPADMRAEINECLAPFMRVLVGKDETRRQAAVAHALHTGVPMVLDLIADRLVDRLKTGGAGTNGQAALSLVGLGAAAYLTLRRRLLATRSPRLQVRLVEVLTEVAPRLHFRDSTDAVVVLEMVRLRTRDEAVLASVLRAMTSSWQRRGTQQEEGDASHRSGPPFLRK